MRPIENIVLHCTATSQKATVQSIQKYWKEKMKWKVPGYHFLITPDGTIHELLSIEIPSNGVAGHNSKSIHVSYIGGVDKDQKGIDNRTPEQKKAMEAKVKELKAKFPNARVLGHRDFPNVHKECPCFDAAAWWGEVTIPAA